MSDLAWATTVGLAGTRLARKRWWLEEEGRKEKEKKEEEKEKGGEREKREKKICRGISGFKTRIYSIFNFLSVYLWGNSGV